MAKVTFSDDLTFSANDWARIKAVIAEKARKQQQEGGRTNVVKEIISNDGVKIKLDGLNARPDGKLGGDHSNYVECKCGDWTVRVWRSSTDNCWCCNYYQGTNICYFETNDAHDENDVFRQAKVKIEEAENAH